MDPRPENCRFRLQDEGKGYPRSSCSACGKTIMTGLGTHCTSPAANVTVDDVRQAAREAAEEIRRQRERIAELEAALKPFAAIGAQIRWLDGSGYTTARLRVDDIVAAQKTLKR